MVDRLDSADAVKPHVPPVLMLALGMWAGSASVLWWCRDAGSAFWAVSGGLFCLFGGVAAFFLVGGCPGFCGIVRGRTARRGGLAAVLCLLLGVFCGGLCGTLGASALQREMAAAEMSSNPIAVRLRLTEDARASGRGATCAARITDCEDEALCGMLVRLSFPDADGDDLSGLRFGAVLHAAADLRAPSRNSAEYCWKKGFCAEASLSEYRTETAGGAFGGAVRVRNAVIDGFADAGARFGMERGAAVLSALVCGNRTLLDGCDVYADCKIAGVAHLIAVSGAHLSIVSSLLAGLLSAFGLRRGWTLAFQAVFLGGYLFVAALPVSAIRACAMAFCTMASYLPKRRASSVNALAVCIVVILAVNPQAALSESFALSAMSTLGIVLFASLFKVWLADWHTALGGSVGEALALTAASSMCSLPLAGALFSQVSVVSPLSNLIAAPLFTLLCTLGVAVGFAMALVPAVWCLSSPLLVLSEVFCQMVHGLAGLPFASIPVDIGVVAAVILSTFLCVLLWCFWPHPSGRSFAKGAALALSVLVAVSAVWPLACGTRIVMLDVGQGDAFLLQSGGRSVLIDTGTSDKDLLEGLASCGVLRLDSVVITHADDDHCGSLTALRGVVRVSRVILAHDALTCDDASYEALRATAAGLVGSDSVIGLSVGDAVSFGRFRMEVLAPPSFRADGGNADSLVLFAQADLDDDGAPDQTALFCGDAEAEQIGELAASSVLAHADILKVGHHGARVALTPELAEALGAEVALISVGEGNRYGHPAGETLKYLADAGTQTFRSDEHGRVSCKLTRAGIRVRTER